MTGFGDNEESVGSVQHKFINGGGVPPLSLMSTSASWTLSALGSQEETSAGQLSQVHCHVGLHQAYGFFPFYLFLIKA